MPEVSKKPVPKWLAVVLIIVVVFAIGALSRALSGPSETATRSDSPPAIAATPKTSFSDGEVTEASVKAALPGVEFVKVEVQDNLGTDAPDDKIVHVSYRPSGASALGEKPMLMDLVKVSANTFEALFSHPKVGAADVTAVVTMGQSDGSEKEQAAARIYWDRKKAESVDYKTYRADVVNGYYWDAFKGAPDFYVHPGVLAGLSESDRAKLQ